MNLRIVNGEPKISQTGALDPEGGANLFLPIFQKIRIKMKTK